jgi:uncharacterized membrane protein
MAALSSLTPEEVSRRRWMGRFLRLNGKYESQIKEVLTLGSKDVEKRLSVLESNPTFSAGVRSAQLRLVLREIKIVTAEIFDEIKPIITTGSQASAELAVDALTKEDREYLRAVFDSTGDVESFTQSQIQTARLGVANAISSITRSNKPLSTRVYESRRLANNWVKNTATAGILRNASAREVARDVAKSIKPSTPGGVAYAALRLGRTELNNAFHATAIESAKNRPWIQGMEWHMSAVHVIHKNRQDLCETYDRQVFDIDKTPGKPHPQCRCWVTPQLLPFDLFADKLINGVYDDWIQDAA